MIQGQHKSYLKNYYEEIARRVKVFLEKNYSSVEVCFFSDTDYPTNIRNDSFYVYKIKIEVLNKPLTLLVAIPTLFPDRLPKIYLSLKDYSNLPLLPHIDKDREICTRDHEVVFINEHKIEESVLEFIQIAINNIQQGINKENQQDVLDEFLAYWNPEATWCALTLFSPSQKIERFQLFTLKSPVLETKYVIAKNQDEAETWLKPLKLEFSNEKIFNVLYLPLNKSFTLPFPTKNRDIYEIIKKNGDIYIQAFDNFYFSSEGRNLIVLFSLEVNGDRILAGWKHFSWNKKDTLKGFTSISKVPLEWKLARSGNINIEKIRIKRLDKQRLFRRIGMDVNEKINISSIAIIGCGSLGSQIAVSLSKCGISDFLLIDKENLEIENICRHTCGTYAAVKNIPKVEAVKDALQKHFPFITCKTYNQDILDILKEDCSLLNNYDFVIVATANKSMERRMNDLLKRGVIRASLMFIWMESFGVGGHLLYISNDNKGCYNCCMTQTGNFKYTIAVENSDFLKRESGCQSTYVPYSNLDIEQFISIIGRKIISIINNSPEKNLLFTWLGDINRFEDMGYKIQERWVAEESFTVHQINIMQSDKCTLCNKK